MGTKRCDFIFVFWGYSLAGNFWLERWEFGTEGENGATASLLSTANVFAALGNSFTVLFQISFFKADPMIRKLIQIEIEPLFHQKMQHLFNSKATFALLLQSCELAKIALPPVGGGWHFCSSNFSTVIMFRFVALVSHLSLYHGVCHRVWAVFYEFWHFETCLILKVEYKCFAPGCLKKWFKNSGVFLGKFKMTGLGFVWKVCLLFGLICLLKSSHVFPSGQMAVICCSCS